jgi:hypothetical protein
MKPVIDQIELYNSGSGPEAEAGEALRRLQQILELIKQTGRRPQPTGAERGRNLLTRALDAALAAARRYVPPLHWLGAAIVAAVFFIYTYLLALTEGGDEL